MSASDLDADRLARRLNRPGLAALVDQLARRFAETGAPVTVRLGGLAEEEQQALADLLGEARLRGPAARLAVRRVLTALGTDLDTLRAAVNLLRGPLTDRPAERQARRVERRELWEWFAAETAGVPVIAAHDHWLARVRQWGVRGGITEHRQRLSKVVRVLAALPSEPVTLAEFAADMLGDPHALDAGRSVAALVLDAVEPARRRDAERTRALWESVGVAPDALSSTVLALGLRTVSAEPLSAFLGSCAAVSEPCLLTLSQLRRWPLSPLDPNQPIFVVENPSMIAAAARSGWPGPPLICSSGRPTVAVLTLIRQLTAAGATAFQHADFDPIGVAITGWLADRAGTVPWQMTATEYSAIAQPDWPEAERFQASIPPTPWDPQLAITMTERGIAVYEEQLRDSLLRDMIALGE